MARTHGREPSCSRLVVQNRTSIKPTPWYESLILFHSLIVGAVNATKIVERFITPTTYCYGKKNARQIIPILLFQVYSCLLVL